MMEVVYIALGLALGAAITWVITTSRHRVALSTEIAAAEKRANSAEGAKEELQAGKAEAAEDFKKLRDTLNLEQEAKIKAQTELKEKCHQLDEQKQMIEQMQERLKDTFKSLAADTLSNSNKSFLELARETLGKVLVEAKGDLGQRQEAIDGLVKPLSEQLKQYQVSIRTFERETQEAYGSLEKHLTTLTEGQTRLQHETGNLVTALRKPEVRGRWGEITLRRVIELSGMSEHCDFSEQVTVTTDDQRLRPDLIVHLPADREIVVDAKVSLDAYLDALSAETETERRSFLAHHARQLRRHMNSLSAKSYWEQFTNSPEIVVMFIPGESFFAAAVDIDHSLIEDGMEKRVVLATPTTLIALLRSIAYGWRQEQIGKNARKISELGRQLHERMRVLADHLNELGKGLGKANNAYNSAVASVERRIFPAARRFKELGSTTTDDIPLLEPLDSTPREIDTRGTPEGPETP